MYQKENTFEFQALIEQREWGSSIELENLLQGLHAGITDSSEVVV
ncbi:hypothetical protein [Natronomonas moolapensis]|nr:hypothetical protein [Natronomonas moolapensis]